MLKILGTVWGLEEDFAMISGFSAVDWLNKHWTLSQDIVGLCPVNTIQA